MGLRSFLPQVSACPGCGRTTSTFFQEMAQQIQTYLKDRMPEWKEIHPGVEEMRVAVMGCVVNGPGESKHADIGISLPGTFEEPVAPVFIDGKLDRTLRGEGLVDEFVGILEDYVAATLPGERDVRAPRTGARADGLTASPAHLALGPPAGPTGERGPNRGRSGHAGRRLVRQPDQRANEGAESGPFGALPAAAWSASRTRAQASRVTHDPRLSVHAPACILPRN